MIKIIIYKMKQESDKIEERMTNKTYIGLNDVVDDNLEEQLYKNNDSWEDLGVPDEIITSLKTRGFK